MENNIVRELACKLTFGAQHDQVRLKLLTVEMPQEREEYTLRPASLQRGSEEHNLRAESWNVHRCQSIISRLS